jgi:hypothetical protein
MTLVVEDGTGVYNANAYCGRAFVLDYLTVRNKATTWSAATTAAQEAAIIGATDYVEMRFGLRFRGQKQFINVEYFANNALQIVTNPTTGDTVTIGDETYTFRTSASTANEVTIGAAASDTALNLVRAITGGSGEGSLYGTGTTAHSDVTASLLDSGNTILVEAQSAGVLSTDIVTTASDDDALVWDTGKLIGGSAAGEQPLSWPRNYAYTNRGVAMTGVPLKLKQAIAEYANRALSAVLAPDPDTNSTGQIVSKTYEKIGPLEFETEFLAGGSTAFFKKYPAADMLLRELITGTGGVIR